MTDLSRLALALLPALVLPAAAQDRRDATSREGMVVSTSPDAADAGAAVLRRGGNAVDAAVATAFAMAVTHPTAGNIGGGGFMLVYPSDGSPPQFIDYREKAPQAATPDMFEAGGSRKNHRYAGVPGTVRGLSLAHELYGLLPWEDLVEPAVRLAKDGFVIHGGLAASLNRALRSSENAEFKRVYGKPSGKWAAGDRLTLPDLGATLARIAAHRNAGFYGGKTAELLVAEMQRGGGSITAADLAAYRARVRTPIRFTYRGFDVYSAPPPSSGGITLAQQLQILETFDVRRFGRWSPRTLHLMVEAMRRAYAQRAQHLGDTDFVDVPVRRLSSKSFAAELAEDIDQEKATPSDALGPKVTEQGESKETTHFSVIDKSGMAVSNTYTLEAGYGSGVVVRGAGFLLNNEMGDFNPRPGVTTRRGTIGTPANVVAPGKRMLSSMTPTIVTRDGKPYLITGSPGGRTIINTVFCVLVNVLEFGMDLRAAIDAPRMDHEWFPDRVRMVGAGDPARAAAVTRLRAMGHDVQASRYQGDANSILVRRGVFHGAADNRWGGAAGLR